MGGKRAAWKPAMEQTLLELFEAARQDPEARTGRGVKAQTWTNIVSEINSRCNSSFIVGASHKFSKVLL